MSCRCNSVRKATGCNGARRRGLFEGGWEGRMRHRVYITPFVWGGPIGPRLFVVTVPLSEVAADVDDVEVVFNELPPIEFVVDFIMKNFSNLAIMCLPYVYFRREPMCGRILCIRIFRWVGSETSIIFWTT